MGRMEPCSGLPETYVEGFHDVEKVKLMNYRKLGSTNKHVSALGFGASALAGVFHEVNEEECINVVQSALKAGINIIDTAPWYGQGRSEIMLGKALRGVPRQAYMLNTKVGRYEQDIDKMFDFTAERVTRSVDESLERMGVEYIDCIQVHDMEFCPSLDIIINETLPALERLRQAGKVRFIGITGYPLDQFEYVLERSTVTIDVVLSYCRNTLMDSSLSSKLLYLNSKGVGIINAAPNAMGLLTQGGPPDWHPASEHIRRVCAQANALCAAKGVDIARLAVRWGVEDDSTATTLTSFAKMTLLQSNLENATVEFSPIELETLDELRRLFAHHGNMHWEGVEVSRYWQALGKKLQIEKLYTRA